MWKQLKALITFDAFCKGCETYYEMSVALGLAPAASTANGMRLIDHLPSEPSIFPIQMTPIYIMKGSRNIPRLVASIPSSHNIDHLN